MLPLVDLFWGLFVSSPCKVSLYIYFETPSIEHLVYFTLILSTVGLLWFYKNWIHILCPPWVYTINFALLSYWIFMLVMMSNIIEASDRLLLRFCSRHLIIFILLNLPSSCRVRDVDHAAGGLMVIVDTLWTVSPVTCNLWLPLSHVLLHPSQQTQHWVCTWQSDISSSLC